MASSIVGTQLEIRQPGREPEIVSRDALTFLEPGAEITALAERSRGLDPELRRLVLDLLPALMPPSLEARPALTSIRREEARRQCDTAQRQVDHRREQRRERVVAGGDALAVHGAQDAEACALATRVRAAAALGQGQRRVDRDHSGPEAHYQRIYLFVRPYGVNEPHPVVAAHHRDARRVAGTAAEVDAEGDGAAECLC